MDKEQYLIIHSRHINNYIYNFVAQKTKTLDVGCNMGNLGEKLIKEKNCKVWGIDYCEKAIEIAKKKLTKAIVFDLETYQIPFSKEKFDLIIFADVLEHTRYPEIILRKYLSILNEGGGGVIIASIPNVSNIKIRLKLLFGKWDYKNFGILDKTHLRFFTRKTIKELFENSEYKIIKIDSTPGFDFVIFKYFKFLKKIAKYLCKIYPKLFALQFIVIAKKNDKT